MNKEKLIAAGVNYDEGVQRFGGREEKYQMFLEKFFDGPLMGTLERQLGDEDIAGAFRTAHDLKGATGNLSLSACYQQVCVLTELLRNGVREMDYSQALAQVKALYKAAECAVREE